MRTDPTDNGGLFVGRRPGTAPTRYRALPERGSRWRRRRDAHRWPTGSLALMVVLNLLFWGPIPAGALWVASQVQYRTDQRRLGHPARASRAARALFAGLAVLKRLDRAWILVRRAAGIDQRVGVLGRVFATPRSSARSASPSWLLLHRRPRLPRSRRGEAAAALLPPVRGPERAGGQRGPARAGDERRAEALARIEPLDLSRTTWPEYPPLGGRQRDHLRGAAGLHRYLDPHAAALRSELAHHLDVGRGAARRRRRHRPAPGRGGAGAARARRRAGDARGRRTRCTRSSRGARAGTPSRCRASGSRPSCGAINDRTRIVALCNPNDPTGELVAVGRRCAALLRRCPSASSSSSTRRCATSSTPSRATRRSPCSPTPAAPGLPHLLQGVGPGRAALGYALGGPGRRGAARAARARARRSTSSPRGSRPARGRSGRAGARRRDSCRGVAR